LRFALCFALLISFCLAGCGGSDGADGTDRAAGKDAARGKDQASNDTVKDSGNGLGKDGKPAGPADELVAGKLGDMAIQKFGDLYMGGQPSEEVLEAAKKSGVLHVVNLRGASEDAGFDEENKVAVLGMRYHNPGFSKAEELTVPVFMRLRDLLSNKANRPMLLHCASANRVGAVWLAHRVLDDGLAYDKALAEAKQVGLRSKALEAVAKAYIDTDPDE
jgi:protein tyrosine phosphatase (PTP) superfamily phosphohydrolase (DUF442 family)